MMSVTQKEVELANNTSSTTKTTTITTTGIQEDGEYL